jgi:diguanylate cyclase (GGDEF)-like protein
LTIWALIPLITCIAYLILLVLTLPSTARRENRIFALYLAAAAVWSFTAFMLHFNAFPEEALLWNELLVTALIWALISYYHFIRAYVKQPAGIGVYLGYMLVLVLAVLSLNGKIVQYAHVVDGVLYHSLGISIYFIGVVSLAFITLVIIQLTQRYRGSVDPTDRNRTMYLISGWSIMVLLTYTNFIPSVAGLPLDHIGSLINAVIISYTISRFQLLDIRFLIRRGLTYLLVIGFLGGIYAGAVFLGQAGFPGQPIYLIVLVATLLVILLALVARPLRQVIQEGIDRLFYRETYTYRQALLSFSSRVGSIINLNELADEMLPTIGKALRITQAKLMFQQNGGGNFASQFSYPKTDAKSGDELSFSLDNPIVAWLEKESSPLDLKQIDSIPQLKALWQTDREKLVQSKLELLYPIKSRGKLIGILALGQKKDDALYTHEDIELVKSMASQAGIIVENARVYSQAVTWANTDGLTELYNHRHFHERLDQEIARGSRFGAIFSLIMLDLDHFKTFNDNYGHLAGDEVLRKIGRCIEGSIRSVDMAFRYGGEEFAAILPETRLDDAYKVAERIRKTIEAKATTGTMPVTASLGISSWPVDGMTKEDIISRADAALYQAKLMGRNRTCLSSEVVKGQTSLISLELETKARALSIIYALAATVDAKDHYTYGHSKKVSQYAVSVSELLGLPADRTATIRAAGLLHDIGKIAIPDSVLNKNGPLTDEEWEPVKAHPELGVEILKHVIDLVNCLPAILHHHEHYDGTGYPAGLKGDEIPLEARILAIADAYDAITSIRSYHQQLSPRQALDELRRCAGTQFDPELVKIFCQAIEQHLPKELQIE